ncbi:phage tail assembly protein [Insolitispirillum peregrinum]|uniref:Phage tail assembly chaperone protein, E, or 41 or 14 n=1 Tax=Insolitispirillum peregrinum TaxID=80876 RepID=A0A1N7JL23_9PROT|nr:phage tail assembly protein [Insolitispirillum peregrinum]SIS50007.1 Phage tail assembly chaperone protein, E, or 41 or 14 [Insolitispirillum peregrinum]
MNDDSSQAMSSADPSLYAVSLGSPVHLNGATYHTLHLRPPTVGDQLDAVKPGMSNAEAELALITRLTGVPLEVIRQLLLTDYHRLQEILLGFFSRTPGTSAGT